MGIVEKAPKKIVWRAINYYQQNKVREVHAVGENCYTAKVAGSGKADYDVFIDIAHPKKCTCTCPFAKENNVICKHMVAAYFSVNPDAINDFEEDERRYVEDKDYRWQKDKEKMKVFARKLSKEELVDALAECWLELESYRLKDR